MIGIGAALAALALLLGGLFVGGTLVSAQEPTPEVTQEAEPATPDATDQTPDEDDGTRSKEECGHQQDEGSDTGISFRGGPRTFAQ
jgi:hypothetical protein